MREPAADPDYAGVYVFGKRRDSVDWDRDSSVFLEKNKKSRRAVIDSVDLLFCCEQFNLKEFNRKSAAI